MNIPKEANAALKYVTVHFNTAGGTTVSNKKVPYKGLISVPKSPKKTGYTFLGWYKDKALKKTWNLKKNRATANMTLYSKWTINTYKVTFNSKGGTTVTQQKVRYKGHASAPKNPTKKGYKFVGWYKDSAYKKAWNYKTSAITGNITLYAKWAAVNVSKVKVTFNSNGGTQVPVATISYNSVVSLPSVNKTGYKLAGWYQDSGLKKTWSSNTKVTTNITLYAKWSPNTYTISYDSKGGNQVKNQLVTYGNLVPVPSVPTKTGYTFSGWYTTSDLKTKYNFSNKVTANLALYAKWDIVSGLNSYMAIIPSNVSLLNVRTSPDSTNSNNIIGTLSKSNIINVYPSSSVGWYQLDYKGQTAYISSKLSSGSSSVQLVAYATIITAAASANIYTTTDVSSPVIGTIKKGAYTNVIPVPDNLNFVQVAMSGGKYGYIQVSDTQRLFYNTLNIRMPSKVTAAQIDGAIENYEKTNNKTSVFHGMGQTFINVGNTAGINPLILAGIAIHESGWGTSNLAKYKYNIFSVAAYDGSAYDSAYTYNSVEEAIKYQADFLNKNYLNSIYATGNYTMMGDFLGTGGLESVQSLGQAGINAYYATGITWGAGIANICQSILPYKTSDYTNVAPMVPKALYNVVLKSIDNDFTKISTPSTPITGKNRGAVLTLYTSLGGQTPVTDSNGNKILLSKYETPNSQNDGTFKVLHFYGNSMNGWMQITTTYAGTAYPGYVNFGGLSNYASKFTLDNLMRNTANWSYNAQVTAELPSGYTKCYR